MSYTLSEAYFDLYNPRVNSNFNDNLKFVENLQKEDIEDVVESIYWELRDYGHTFDEAFDLIDCATDVEIMLEATDQIILEAKDAAVRVTYGGKTGEYGELSPEHTKGGVFTRDVVTRGIDNNARQRASERASIIKNATKAVRSSLSGPIRSVKQAISGATGGFGRAKAAVSTGAAKMGGAAQEAKARLNQLLRKGVKVAGQKAGGVGKAIYKSGEAARNAPARSYEFNAPGLGKLNVSATPNPTAGAKRMAVGKTLRRAGAAIQRSGRPVATARDTSPQPPTSAGVPSTQTPTSTVDPFERFFATRPSVATSSQQRPPASPRAAATTGPAAPVAPKKDPFERFFATRPSVATASQQRPPASPRAAATTGTPSSRQTGQRFLPAAGQTSSSRNRFADFFSGQRSATASTPQSPAASRRPAASSRSSVGSAAIPRSTRTRTPETPSSRQTGQRFLPAAGQTSSPQNRATGRTSSLQNRFADVFAGRQPTPRTRTPETSSSRQTGQRLLPPAREPYSPPTRPSVSRGTAEALRRQAQRRQDQNRQATRRGTPLLPSATRAVSRPSVPTSSQKLLPDQIRRERLGIPRLSPAYEMPSPLNPRSGQKTPPSSLGRRPYGGPGRTVTGTGVPYSKLSREKRKTAAMMQRVSRERRATGLTSAERSAPPRSTEPVYGRPSWAGKSDTETSTSYGLPTFYGFPTHGDRLTPRMMRHRSRIRENFDPIIETICEDLVNYGYAYDFNDAVDVVSNLSEDSFNNIIAEYLN